MGGQGGGGADPSCGDSRWHSSASWATVGGWVGGELGLGMSGGWLDGVWRGMTSF